MLETIQQSAISHDRYQVELKLDYQVDRGKETHYRISTYIFVPRSLGITEESYPKNELYRDIKNYIRIKTPRMSLRDLIDGNTSPLRTVQQNDFRAGTFFVVLAPLEDSGLVASTIVQTLGFAETELKSHLELLKDGIGDKHMLLVLDNLEHLIEDAASVVSDLLSACPHLKILTTSREALRMPGEWLYSVPALNIPAETQLQSMDMEQGSQYAALALFAERARAVRSDFALSAENNGYPTLYANLLNHLGRHCWMLDDFDEGNSLLNESREIWLTLGVEGEQGLAETFRWLGAIAFWGEADKNTAQSYYEQSLKNSQKHGDQHGAAVSLAFLARINYSAEWALGMFEQSLDLFRQLCDLYYIAVVFMHLGWKSRDQGDFEKARLFYTQRLEIDEELEFKEGIAETLLYMGELSILEGDDEQAEQFLLKSLLISREYGLKLDESYAYHYLGVLSLHRNDYRLAARYFEDDYRMSHRIPDKMKVFELLLGLTAIAAGFNQPERAAKLYGATQAIFEKSPYMPRERSEFERHIQIAREQLGEERFEVLTAEGRAMTVEQAVAYALEE